ncbi:MAG: polymerase, sigma-24 subunit, subfamily [Bacteroidota bacterium]|nr:polymerase, sigma-24 subunit, subfamily [Bacteroidota bacterium]
MNAHHKTESDLKLELQHIEAAKDNPARFNILYDKYYKQIFIFVHRRTGEEELTADLVSQVFLKALVNIKKYEFKGVPFSAWLFRIAFNEINMYFRRNNAVRIVSLEQGSLGSLIAETEEEDNTEAQQKMLKALKQMSDEDTQLIELRFFEKRSFAEVGDIVGITENNAKVRVYRILDKIKKIMGNNR